MAQALNNSSSLATTSILLLLFLFLHHLFLFSSTTTATTTTPVLDIEGNPLEAGSEYHIISPISWFAGGLGLMSRPNSLCPEFVFRSTSEPGLGRPVKFLPLNSTQKTIDVSDVISIQFTGPSVCRSTVWHLTRDPFNGQIYVSNGRGPSSFKIEKMGNRDGQYKISYTYDEEFYYHPNMLGGDIGTLPENGISWLGVSDEPLTVYFDKKLKQYNKVQ